MACPKRARKGQMRDAPEETRPKRTKKYAAGVQRMVDEGNKADGYFSTGP